MPLPSMQSRIPRNWDAISPFLTLRTPDMARFRRPPKSDQIVSPLLGAKIRRPCVDERSHASKTPKARIRAFGALQERGFRTPKAFIAQSGRVLKSGSAAAPFTDLPLEGLTRILRPGEGEFILALMGDMTK